MPAATKVGTTKTVRPTSEHYLSALLVQMRRYLPREVFARLHAAALPSSGGAARAAAIRRAKEASGTHLEPGRSAAPAPPANAAQLAAAQQAAAQSAQLAKAEAGEEPDVDADLGNEDYQDLPVEVQGAIYELCEEAGLVGEEGGSIDAPPDVMAAIYVLGSYYGLCPGMEEVDLEKDELTSTDMGGNPANSAPLKNVSVAYTQGGSGGRRARKKKPEAEEAELEKAEAGEAIWIEKAEEESHIVRGVVLQPGVFDSHGHRVSEVEIEKAAHRFAEKVLLNKAGFDAYHDGQARDGIKLLENSLAPVTFQVVNPAGQKVTVLKGSWLQALKVDDAGVWKDVQEGRLGSLSVHGDGWQIPVEETA